MNIDLIAELKTSKEFFEEYKLEDEKKIYWGKSLIFYSVANTDLESRYTISNFLLDKGVDVTLITKDNDSVLHYLLDQREHDLNETINLCKKFIELGADINALDNKKVLALQRIINMGFADLELEPLYDIWFSQPNIDVTTKNFKGVAPIELVQKFPNRCALYERMKKYAE